MARGVGAGVAEPVVERGVDACRGGAVGVEGGGAGLDDLAGLPEAGGLVHVLVEPALPWRQVEALHEVDELRVQRPEQRGRLLEEGRGHEGGVRRGGQRAVERVEAVGDGRVEAVHG